MCGPSLRLTEGPDIFFLVRGAGRRPVKHPDFIGPVRAISYGPNGPLKSGCLTGLRPAPLTRKKISGPSVRRKLGPHIEIHRFAGFAAPLRRCRFAQMCTHEKNWVGPYITDASRHGVCMCVCVCIYIYIYEYIRIYIYTNIYKYIFHLQWQNFAFFIIETFRFLHSLKIKMNNRFLFVLFYFFLKYLNSFLFATKMIWN